MSLYPLFRKALFALPAECAHDLAIKALSLNLVPAEPDYHPASLKSRVFGLDFPSPIGLAAGFDKNAAAIANIQKQGFGFLECGTVTPRPQEGNPKPRLFRLEADQAIINRLGFNNKGLAVFVQNMEAAPRRVPLGSNIGKNKDSEDALADYLEGLRRVYPVSDYITVNISSPNTVGLRDLQGKHRLEALLDGLLKEREQLSKEYGRTIPLLLKIAPDLATEDLSDIAQVMLARRWEGCIVSNTTIDRPLSLKPLFEPSTRALKQMYQLTGGQIPLVGVGGIRSGADAYAKIKAGASLVQLYTGLIYEGFGLVTRIKRDLATLLEKDGFASLSQAVGKDSKE
jgi:dihydroorotate dehydrogenase